MRLIMPYPAVVFWQKLSVLRKQSAVAFALLGGQGDMPSASQFLQVSTCKKLGEIEAHVMT